MLREALTFDRLYAMTPEEASAHFVSRSADGLNSHEQDLLSAWLAADRAHALAYERANKAWCSFDDAGGDEILSAMRDHAIATRARVRGGLWYAIAASIAVLLVAASVLVSPLRQLLVGPASGPGVAQPVWVQYASSHGEVRNVRLPDGSIMTLDTDSVAQTHFAPGERSIRLLKGRGLFEVAKDVARPFAVAAADRRVVALGTRFEVDTTDDELRVSLFRGKVAVQPLASGRQTVVLDPGQRFSERRALVTVLSIDTTADEKPGWMSGLIDFNDTPLRDAATEINRYSRTRIDVSDPTIAAIRVSGQFRTGDAGRFAQTLSEVYPVRVEQRAGAIELVSSK
jgi:transmembrane sensor